MVTNDIEKRVIHLISGWPGSAHDARVLKGASFMQESKDTEFFSGRQHGLGYAAFPVHRRLVPGFKQPLADIPANKVFNHHLSSLRIRSEHTIELAKERFQGLKEVRLKIRSHGDVSRVAQFITCGYILHNLLLEWKDLWDDDCVGSGSFEPDEYGNTSSDPTPENTQGAAVRERAKEEALRFLGYI